MTGKLLDKLSANMTSLLPDPLYSEEGQDLTGALSIYPGGGSEQHYMSAGEWATHMGYDGTGGGGKS